MDWLLREALVLFGSLCLYSSHLHTSSALFVQVFVQSVSGESLCTLGVGDAVEAAYFTVSNEWYSGLSDFKYNLESVIWERWAYSGYQGMDEVASIVSAIMNDADNEAIRALVASWAGDIVVVERRQHAHTAKETLRSLGAGASTVSRTSSTQAEHTSRQNSRQPATGRTQDGGQVTPHAAQLGS